MACARNALDGSRVYFEDEGGEGATVVLHGGFGESVDVVRGSPIAQGIPADEFRHITSITVATAAATSRTTRRHMRRDSASRMR